MTGENYMNINLVRLKIYNLWSTLKFQRYMTVDDAVCYDNNHSSKEMWN